MIFQNPSQETFILKLYKRKAGNTSYEYDTEHPIIFRGEPTTDFELKSFRITKGVNGTANGVNLKCSNLPNVIDIEDRVEYLGVSMLVKNIGYFYTDERIVNKGIFSDDYIKNRCPKGITIG